MLKEKVGKQLRQKTLQREQRASVGTKGSTYPRSMRVTDAVINLQVFLQPLVLLKEELQAKFKIEIDLC